MHCDSKEHQILFMKKRAAWKKGIAQKHDCYNMFRKFGNSTRCSTHPAIVSLYQAVMCRDKSMSNLTDGHKMIERWQHHFKRVRRGWSLACISWQPLCLKRMSLRMSGKRRQTEMIELLCNQSSWRLNKRSLENGPNFFSSFEMLWASDLYTLPVHRFQCGIDLVEQWKIMNKNSFPGKRKKWFEQQ